MKYSYTRKELQLEKQLEQLEKDLAAEKKKRKVVCGNCKKPIKIGDVDIIDEYGYIPPSGCIGGDYWTHSCYEFHCPKCNACYRLGPMSWTYTQEESPEMFFRQEMYNWIKDNQYNAKSYTIVKPERRRW